MKAGLVKGRTDGLLIEQSELQTGINDFWKGKSIFHTYVLHSQ